MGLELKPSIDSVSREELEAHIEAVRARRLSAAIEYQQGVDTKYRHEQDKLQRKLNGEYKMLGRELEQFDRIDGKLQYRLQRIEQLKHEVGLIEDLETGELT